ncbi:coiled-coil domain-containing protein 96-like [Plakobranchus ocellatus]|uniref:Coiled-coil domain-containing protein 96-like n=1 Tax=Plakobranchus ocellatus TaxID=259542 RepID=A0AAV4DC49_9GAST|nr:coiled-coil domain-containing protein 96-like [Plakobranchus ocellatus]
MAEAEEDSTALLSEEQPEAGDTNETDLKKEEAPEISGPDDAGPQAVSEEIEQVSNVEVKEEVPGDEQQPSATTEVDDENIDIPENDKPKEPVDSSGNVDVEPSVEKVESVEPVENVEASAAGEAGSEEAAKPEEDAEAQEGAEKTGDQSEQIKSEAEPSAEEEQEKGKLEEGQDAEAKDEVDAAAEEGEEQNPDEEGEEKPSKTEVPETEDDTVAVGESLSREATPDASKVELEQERPEATSPDQYGDQVEDREQRDEEGEFVEPVPEEEEDEEEIVETEQEEEEPAFRRQELIERYQDALAERDQLQQQNYGLQHKLAEHFKKKKADERQDYDKNVTDQEQRYLKYMAQLEELRRQDSTEKQSYRAYIEDAKNRCQEKKERVDAERKKFMEFKKQVALNALNSRSGKPIPPKDIEQYMVNEVKKEHEVVNVRLENIKLKNKLKKKEQQLKSKEELAEGLHLIDFEQLKIENQTYNEKIEERNEELLKLRKKITSTVQVLTHLKEKLQFVQGENLEQTNELKEVESELAKSRDILSRTKQARDALRIDNHKLRQNCGLLGSEPLLRDFEERKDESDELLARLETLKMRHAELTLHCNQVRRKIDQARLQAA